MRAIKDLSGKRFGLLKVVRKTQKRASGGSVVWSCVCDCGNVTDVSSGKLNSGHTISCGCYKRAVSSIVCSNLFRKHGHGRTGNISRTYSVWIHMLNRCNNPINSSYSNYGGRGIVVCERWRIYENFLKDMGEKPNGNTLDRIDNNGNYELGNCRWVTMKVQQNNKRNNRKVNYMGKDMTISQLSERCGVNRGTLIYRIKKGMTVEEAVSK